LRSTGWILKFDKGEIVAIVGTAGCAKSTFLDLLIGLESATSGEIEIGGKNPFDDFKAFRGKVGTIFQQDRLLPWRNSLDNVKLPLELLGIANAEQVRAATYRLDRLGLQRFLHAYPHELSGGMRQRVAIARAFVLRPQLLLADEAFSALDEVTAGDLRKSFIALAHEIDATAILITHQLEEAIEVGDRVIVFGKGAALLADTKVANWPASRHGELRRAIQSTLSNNVADPIFAERLGSS
jgi:NitT/TauT family transport system ATP-binding protein